MGGSSSAQEVTLQKQPLKNYNEDAEIKKEAEKKGIQKELLAYQRQKSDKSQEFEMVRARNKEDKMNALIEQEALLQERIEKAQEEVSRVTQLREEARLQHDLTAPVKVETSVKREVITSKQQESPNNKQNLASKTAEHEALNSLGDETPGPQQSSKVPSNEKSFVRIVQNTSEELKKPELAHKSTKSRATDADHSTHNAHKNDDRIFEESPFLKNDADEKEKSQPQQSRPASNEYADALAENEHEHVERSIPGQQGIQLAKAQISTISYHDQQNSRSTGLILQPPIGDNQYYAKAKQSHHVLGIGLNSMETTEDQEAARNRKINVNELQSLFS